MHSLIIPKAHFQLNKSKMFKNKDILIWAIKNLDINQYQKNIMSYHFAASLFKLNRIKVSLLRK